MRARLICRLMVLFLGMPIHAKKPRTVTIGTVMDGPSPRPELFDDFKMLLHKEIVELAGAEFVFLFPEEHQASADWTVAGVTRAAETLLRTPEVDLVIGVGPLSSQVLASLRKPSKPVLATMVFDPVAQGIPFKDGKSGVHNVSYVTVPLTPELSMRTFHRIVGFRRLAVILPDVFLGAFPDLGKEVRARFAADGITLDWVPIGRTAESVVAALPPEADAAFILPLPHFSGEEIAKLGSALADRGLPSFSHVGRPHVVRGILLGLAAEDFWAKVARRVALNVQRTLLGEDPSGFHVTIAQGAPALTLNMKTARVLGFKPGWDVLSEAELVATDELELEAREVSLGQVAREAVAANLQLLAGHRGVEAGRHEAHKALAPYLPHLSVSGAGQMLDKDRARSPLSPRERTLIGRAKVSQLLFSEPVIANLSIQDSLQEGREAELKALEFDIIEAATVGYLLVLETKTLEKIQKANLELTKKNLDLARVRQAVGVARPAEVHRWESLIATAKKAVIEAVAYRNRAEINLNRLLHRPLEEPFRTADEDLFSGCLGGEVERLRFYVNNPWNFGVFRQFMVEEALRDAPELARLDHAVAAQQRALLSAELSHFLPSLGVEFSVDHLLAEGGVGEAQAPDPSTPLPLLAALGSMFPEADDTNWTAMAFLAWDLFDGGGKIFEQQRSAARLAELQAQRDATGELIEQRVRSTLHDAGSSFPGMRLAREAAEASRKSLDLITEAYASGAVSILDLIDVQTTSTQADLAAAAATHDFFIDLMAALRAIGSPDLFADPDKNQEWLQRLAEFARQAGLEPPAAPASKRRDP